MAYGLEDEMLPVLVRAFPKAFFPRGQNCMPLRVGIFEALDAALPPEIDRSRLKLYLGIYTKQPRYLRELIKGATRIDLNGKPAGRVSAKEAASAAARLQKLQGLKLGQPMPKAAGALSPPSAAPAPPAVNRPRRQDLADLTAPAWSRDAVQAKPQKVVVVVKKRKASSTDARQSDFGSL